MSPLANNDHMELMTNLAAAFRNAFAAHTDVHVFAGVNVSDEQEDLGEKLPLSGRGCCSSRFNSG